MREVKITVAGKVYTGKSSIAYCIRKCLESNGFKDIIIEDVDKSDGVIIQKTLDKRLQSLSENNLKIKIKTEQIRRA